MAAYTAPSFIFSHGGANWSAWTTAGMGGA